jgi:hypothetical protein
MTDANFLSTRSFRRRADFSAAGQATRFNADGAAAEYPKAAAALVPPKTKARGRCGPRASTVGAPGMGIGLEVEVLS